MRRVKCKSGHFYDADKTTLCPHCGAGEAKDGNVDSVKAGGQEMVSSTEKRRGLFGGAKRVKTSKTLSSEINVAVQEDDPTRLQGEATEGFFKSTMAVDIQESYAAWQPDDNTPIFGSEEKNSEPVVAGAPVAPMMQAETTRESVKRDIDSVKTISIYADKEGGEPVTGWLVCVVGEHYGNSFELKSGQCSVGRDSSMDICLKKESSVSRERHAYIIFEPKKRQFILKSGDEKGLTYCNDELVMGMVTLNAYDRIQFGEAEFIFVPFCGEHFMWEKAEK